MFSFFLFIVLVTYIYLFPFWLDWFYLNLIHISSLIPHRQSAQCDHHSYQLGLLISMPLFPLCSRYCYLCSFLWCLSLSWCWHLILFIYLFIYLFILNYIVFLFWCSNFASFPPLYLLIPSVKFGFCDFPCHSIIWKVYAFVI